MYTFAEKPVFNLVVLIRFVFEVHTSQCYACRFRHMKKKRNDGRRRSFHLIIKVHRRQLTANQGVDWHWSRSRPILSPGCVFTKMRAADLQRLLGVTCLPELVDRALG
jgi:hypothetical protein